MHLNQRKEKLSRAYVSALCAAVGCSIAEWDVDDDSVDLTLKKTNATGPIRSPMLDLQLKATARASIGAGGVAFPVKTKNFDDLTKPAHYPRVLVVVTLPSDDVLDWLDHSDLERLAMIACGYWGALEHVSPPNPASTTVRLGLDRILTADALDDLMERVSHSRPLVDAS